jgi:hypothetical protein
MSAKKATPKSAKSTTASGTRSKGFTDEERSATKERGRERVQPIVRNPMYLGLLTAIVGQALLVSSACCCTPRRDGDASSPDSNLNRRLISSSAS